MMAAKLLRCFHRKHRKRASLPRLPMRKRSIITSWARGRAPDQHPILQSTSVTSILTDHGPTITGAVQLVIVEPPPPVIEIFACPGHGLPIHVKLLSRVPGPVEFTPAD